MNSGSIPAACEIAGCRRPPRKLGGAQDIAALAPYLVSGESRITSGTAALAEGGAPM